MFPKLLCVLSLFVFWASPLLQAQSPCTRDTSFHIVVLGSSTAAGSGANPSDSAWVNRYRSHLQALNPAYQVTNRAQGGYTTYQLMPSGFQPPANRPSPNATRNITYAISLAPDAIIINLPSNDVSSGYTVQEQMDNWDTIWNAAQAAGIPTWICTTQPKDYGGYAIPIQRQQDVRDSIIARYSPFVIDFWTGLADSSNQLSSTYDSGDGTHLNNQGHRLIFTRARDTGIPDQLYVPPAYPDLSPREIIPLFAPPCGDSMALYQAVLLNRGQNSVQAVPIDITLEYLPNNSSTTTSSTLPANLATCTEDSILVSANTSAPGNYRLTIVSQAPGDQNSSNDTLHYDFSSLGLPSVQVVSDTGCSTGQLQLSASAGPADSIRWYDAPSGGNLVGAGPLFTTPPLANSTTYFAEAARGEFFYRGSLLTTTNNNISWNGTMFDLIADTALVLDSLSLKITTTGNQTVQIYRRTGTHIGYETNSGAWTFVGDYPVNVPNTSDFVTIGTLGISLNAGDSLALYLQLQNSNSTLGYQSLSAPLTRSNSELRIVTGSGASHNFGGNFYPRDWNGEVFYHYGSKPDGDCQSPRVPVEAVVSIPQVSLGNDTILSTSASIVLEAGSGFASYQWSTGETSSSITLDGPTLGTGIYSIVVEAVDSLGCSASDTIIVVFAPLVGQNPGSPQVRHWPNPNQGTFNVELSAGDWAISILDLHGRQLLSERVQGPEIHRVNATALPAGTYLLHLDGPRIQRSILVIGH